MAAKLKKGDKVLVMTGRDKGKSGEIIKMFPEDNRALVSGVNKVKRHNKPSQMGAGGIEEKEAPIHLSNLAYDAEGKASRIGFSTLKDGTKVRTVKKTKENIAE
ncbi:MAG: 50S ribosomal protein L24 [Rickettsiales bacterium]|nr:50S ribosomal protein L24 [Rickettsiales bacterium]